jgi:hypothetical protein
MLYRNGRERHATCLGGLSSAWCRGIYENRQTLSVLSHIPTDTRQMRMRDMLTVARRPDRVSYPVGYCTDRLRDAMPDSQSPALSSLQ